MGSLCRKARVIHAGGGPLIGAGKSVIVIVVNWNNAEDTIRCLESLSCVVCSGMRILVVDNGSTDRSVELIRQGFPGIEVLKMHSNRGYGGGCNAGFAHVFEERPDYVVFLNNDTLVNRDFLEPLIAPLASSGDVAVTVPRICYMAHPEMIWYAGGVVNLITGNVAHRGIRRKDSAMYATEHETDYATGCCMAMRAADFKQAEGFDPAFMMYGEDVDLSLRIRKSGKRILYVPQSRIWHKVSASEGGEMGARKLWRKNLSMLKLFMKHRAWFGMVSYLVLLPFRLVRGVIEVKSFRCIRSDTVHLN